MLLLDEAVYPQRVFGIFYAVIIEDQIEKSCVLLKKIIIFEYNMNSIIFLIVEVMDYNKPEVLSKSPISMADCKKGPCGRPSCSSKPSGKH